MMSDNPPVLPPRTAMLERMYASDRAADGLFITGVLTTGIYCLPSCPARKPKAENVRFYATESEARDAGLRPCRRCCPDRFYAGRDPDQDALNSALAVLDADPSAISDVAGLAAAVGVGVSKLYALTRRCTGSTPGELIHDLRIQAAKRLLRRGEVGVTDAAFAVGYGSVSAFYERFRRATGSTPREFLRRQEEAKVAPLG